MFVIGQRFLSEMEPELGLGTISEITPKQVTLDFSLREEKRTYSIRNTPIKRVIFSAGDTIETKENLEFIIHSKFENNGIITYKNINEDELIETEISDKISISSPSQKLLSGIIDDSKNFDLRTRVLEVNEYITSSKIRGFGGAKIELIPHQIFIANEVTSRENPRILLSDETGLGKTIEACLIIHRLLLTEKISKVHIILPSSLVNQWFIELLRKFNILFSIINKDSFVYKKSGELFVKKNPVAQKQLTISNIELYEDKEIADLALSQEYDLVLFDEAHHLTIDSFEYEFASKICKKSKSVILLTATPQQLGQESHFARLQLLDSNKFYSFEEFKNEQKKLENTTKHINQIVANIGDLTNEEITLLNSFYPDINTKKQSRKKIINLLIDRHGTGRNLFRNRRSVMEGFPSRKVNLYKISPENSIHDWLKEYILADKKRKSLLICSSEEKAQEIATFLKKFMGSKVTTFVESMTILQRDQSAANFSSEDGALIMVASEIGSEGRNFQFVHNLILVDLPYEAELLEQRIGRVDRIGQQNKIIIHVPFIENSEDEFLANWYHNALSIFENTLTGVYEIVSPFIDNLKEIITNKNHQNLEILIEKCKKRKIEIQTKIEASRDRILELNSYRKEVADEIIDEIIDYINSPEIEDIFLDILEFYGIESTEVSPKTHRLDFTMMNCKDFPMPLMKHDEIIVTFSRKEALRREDFEFITGDHPMLISLIDMFLGEGNGDSTVATIESKVGKKGALFEVVFMPEIIASKKLYLDRFFAKSPIRVVIDNNQKDLTKICTKTMFAKDLKDIIPQDLLSETTVKTKLIPEMLNKAKEVGQLKLNEIIGYSIEDMNDFMEEAIARLEYLKKINSAINQQEIENLISEKNELETAINSARLRVDSVRFIEVVDYLGVDD